MLKLAVQGVAILALAACATSPAPKTSARPPSTPKTSTVSAPRVAVKPQARPNLPPIPSAKSQLLTEYYARTEQELRSQGLLRTDGGGPDTPYSDTDLVRDFTAIGFYDEYISNQGLAQSNGQEVGLTKWLVPIRIGIDFGPSIDAETRKRNTATLAAYTRRLARVTGHPISFVTENPNFTVLFMNEDDRIAAIDRVGRDLPYLSPASLDALRNMPLDIHCLVVTFSHAQNRRDLARAVAVIRAEHPPLTQEACIHEEVAQGLGLANDSPRARPSIFNDDDEFALLTTHDEDLLAMLYSPRLRPGMSIKEASPILRELALERRPDS